MIPFQFRTAGQVHFGAGAAEHAPAEAARFGRRVLLVTGGASLERSGLLARLEQGLANAGVTWNRWQVDREPEAAMVDEGARLCRQAGCEVVLGVGGGSVLDAAKAVSGLAPNAGGVIEYLEDVPGQREVRPLLAPPLPFICVPTTFGTGTEATRNAVVKLPEYGLKRSMREDRLLPRVALVDPVLGRSAPLPVAAASGMDALTHLLEAYLSTKAQPLTDLLALDGIRRAVPALAALADGRAEDAAWEALALASLYGGMALANAGLGAVHGLVAPLGGLFPVPHGAGCACLLPATFRVNVAALRERMPGSPVLERFATVAEVLAPGSGGSPDAAAGALASLRRRLAIPALGAWGVGPGDFDRVIAGARGSSMRTNPVALTDGELEQVLLESMT